MKRVPPISATLSGPSRRQWLGGLLSLGAGSRLTACSAPLPPLRLGSIVFPTYEYTFLARELGWLDEREVRLIELPANTYSLRALAAGQIDACLLTLDEVLTARVAGIDLTVVMVLDISAGADAIFAREPLALSHIKGKRIAVEPGASGALMLDGLLSAAGLKPRDVQTVPITLERSADVWARGEADVVVSAQPWASRIEADGGVRLFDSRAIPNLIVDVLAVRRELLASHPEALRHVVAGILRARQHQVTQPEDASRRMALRLEVAPAEVPEVFMGLRIPGLAENRELMAPGGTMQQSATRLLKLMHEQGLLRRAGNQEPRLPNDLFDTRFLPRTLGMDS